LAIAIVFITADSNRRGKGISIEKETMMTETQFLEYLGELLDKDADMVTEAKAETDPGYVYVRMHTGDEFVIEAMNAIPEDRP
jgi:hypothetical protein